MKHVIVLGGGVAGISAAHELAERGFKVSVYDRQPRYVGGKARSVDVSKPHFQKPLPGEHGFRFFPGFYKHIIDTMARIPVAGNKRGVVDNLVPTDRVMMARFDKPPIVTLVNFPKSLADLEVLIHSIFGNDTGLTKKDMEFFAAKLWQLMTSCYERREWEYERIGWWQYLDADNQSEAFRTYFVGGLTHTLVAAQPKEISTKTGGDILLQLLFLMGDPKAQTDRVLNQPTNDAWLWPWLSYLQSKGVDYHHGQEAVGIVFENGKIQGVRLESETGEITQAEGDLYIFAVPVEVMARLCTPEMIKKDSRLQYLSPLAEDTNWMNGIQFYLNEEIEELPKGHIIFLDSPWALTGISQLQFWKNYDIREHGNGKVKTVLSIDVSDWFAEGLNGKKASECSDKTEIKDEVWAQLEKSLNVDGKVVLRKEMIEDWYLDDDIVFPKKPINLEPLLVNKVNTWSLRPEAYTGIENLFLASDYVRTNTDLATMEGANEAARRAVNSIIKQTGADVPLCQIWDLHEPNVLAVMRWQDKRNFKKGLPWQKHTPWFIKVLHHLNFFKSRIFGN